MSKQLSGGFVSPEWIKDPSLAEPYIDQAAAAGYTYWICLVRYLKARSIFDDKVRDAIGKLADIVHRKGLKFYLDTEPGIWASVAVNESPDSALWVVIPVSLEVFEGNFRIFVPALASHDPIAIANVPAVYGFNEKGMPIELSSEFQYKWQHGTLEKRGFYIDASLASGYTGPLRFYVAVSNSAEIDYASPTVLRLQRELLLTYRDIQLDGVGWDEPGKGHSGLTTFRAGKAFFDLFEATNGYDLRTKLIYLDCFDDTPEAVRVRCDYYRSLSDMSYAAQDAHNSLAKELWGSDILLGTHQTWSGLPADLAGGVFDHFRLGGLLSEAWSDGGYDLELKTTVFPFMLADSLKKGLEKPNAYFNDWIMRDDYGTYKLRNRLKTLFNVNTFTIVYSDFSELMVNLRLEPLKSFVDEEVSFLDRFDQILGTRKGDSQVAIWYGWEGYASLPKCYSRAVYTFFQNTSLFLTDSSIFADLISSEMMEGGLVIDGILHTSNGRYKVLVLPYAYVLPDGIWELIVRWAEAGLKVIFIGPEPAYSAKGKQVEFSKVTGFGSHGLKSYATEIQQRGVHLDPNAWEPAFLDVTPKVKNSSGNENIIHRSAAGKVILAESTVSNISWMPGLDPREDLIQILQPLVSSSVVKVYCGNCYYRTFSDFGNVDDFVLVLSPRSGVPGWGLTPSCLEVVGAPRPEVKLLSFSGVITVGPRIYEFAQCEWAALHFKGGNIVDKLIEGGNFSIKELN